MHLKTNIFRIFLFLGCLILIATMAVAKSAKPIIMGDSQAIQSALGYFGLDSTLKGQDYSKASLTKAMVQDDKFSFMEGNRKGDSVYCIELRDVKFAYAQDTTKRYSRDFKVNIDPKTGQLLSIYSVDDHAGSSDTLPEPSQAINSKMAQRILGPTEDIPTIAFINAMSTSCRNPAETKVIRAILVSYQTNTNKDGTTRIIPAWLIIMRGCEYPLIGARPVIYDSQGHPKDTSEPPVNLRNAVISVINADTGHLEIFTTAPKVLKGHEQDE